MARASDARSVHSSGCRPRYMARARSMSSCWSGGNRSSAHSAARSLRSITPVTTVCQIRASLSSRFRVSSSNSSMNPSISPTIALMQSSTGTGSSDTPGGGPNSGRSPSSTMVSRAVRSGLTAACSAELSPRSKRSRSHSPYCRSKLGGYRQGRTWACATTVTSTQRSGPGGGNGAEIAISPSTSRRFSAGVARRPVITRMSMSLVGCAPPNTADPCSYAPSASWPNVSRTNRSTRSVCAAATICPASYRSATWSRLRRRRPSRQGK